jgi:hypothetical protein
VLVTQRDQRPQGVGFLLRQLARMQGEVARHVAQPPFDFMRYRAGLEQAGLMSLPPMRRGKPLPSTRS